MEFYAISHFQPKDAGISLFVITMAVLGVLSFFGAIFAIMTDKSPLHSVAPLSFTIIMALCSATFISALIIQPLRLGKAQKQNVSQAYSRYVQTVDHKTLISAEKITALDDTESHYYIKRELLRREAQEVAGDLKIIK
jgi:hypothetical protein